MKILKPIGVAIIFGILLACEPQMVDAQIPPAMFQDEIINLNMPEYVSLRVDGGHMILNHIGLRGVIVYRVDSKTYLAYERNCTYHPNESGSIVDVHSSGLYLEDASCRSTFNFTDGQPTGGPAWTPLRQYHTDVTGNILTITSEIIN